MARSRRVYSRIGELGYSRKRRKHRVKRSVGELGAVPRGKCKRTRTGAYVCKYRSGKTRFMSAAQAHRFRG